MKNKIDLYAPRGLVFCFSVGVMAEGNGVNLAFAFMSFPPLMGMKRTVVAYAFLTLYGP